MIKKRVLSLIKIAGICAVLICAGQIRPCFAAFSLSLEPYEGGYDLRFGRIATQDTKVVKELTIRVTTDIGKQYRIYQRVEKPLSTADGIEIDSNQFKMYTLINSNSKGTLENIEEYPVLSSDTVLYTSNTAGEGDSFKVVYTLEPVISQVAGSYYGRLQFILIPIDSTQDQIVETIQMYADLTNEGAVEITTETGSKIISISSKDLEKITSQYPKAYVTIKGNMGTRYRIYQQLSESLVKSVSGEDFDLTKVTYKVVNSNDGAVIKEADLSDLKSKSLLYASDDLGQAVQIAIEFMPTQEFSKQKADFYSGEINYYLELDKNAIGPEPGLIDTIDLEFDIEKIFRIIADSILEDGTVAPEGSPLLHFGGVSYKTGVKESKVRIKIESNLKKPYLVTQKLSGLLQNEAGYKIPKELFVFKLEKGADSTATLKFEADTVVEAGTDTALFVSDSQGNSDEFEVTYKLKVTPDTRGGNYSTGLSYSLSEL